MLKINVFELTSTIFVGLTLNQYTRPVLFAIIFGGDLINCIYWLKITHDGVNRLTVNVKFVGVMLNIRETARLLSPDCVNWGWAYKLLDIIQFTCSPITRPGLVCTNTTNVDNCQLFHIYHNYHQGWAGLSFWSVSPDPIGPTTTPRTITLNAARGS